jgi:ATP-dependent helicase/nuclease subunit B
MSVQFLLGRAGTGKTHWCLQRITESLRADPLGREIYWILPRQATFQAQRQLACASGLNGYFRARILSFEDLGRQVLSECGGSATAEVSELGRRIILGHLLRKNQNDLIFFRHVARHPGVAAELDATFAELDRCAVSPADLQNRQEQFSDPTLNDKLHDLALIYKTYEKFLGQDRIDPVRRFAEALSAISHCPSLRGAEVYVDSFYDFSLHERQVLAAIAKTCKSVFVTLMVDPENPSITNVHHQPDDLSLFYRTEKAYQKLHFAFIEEGVQIDEPLLLKSPRRFQNSDLKAMERWEKTESPIDATGFVRWTEAYDRRAEVDAAARWITQLAAKGYRYRDIAVLMRSEDHYHQLIDASFHEHGIPFFIDRRRTAAHHPLLRLIRAALAVALTRWAHEPVMAFLKTSLAGLDSTETDALENYVLQQGIHHTAWTDPKPWAATLPNPEDFEDPDAESIDARKIQSLRQRLVDRLLPFTQTAGGKSPQTVRGLAGEIFKLLDSLNARATIATWMEQAEKAGNPEERDEHKRVWDELVKLFDELVELLGDEPITLEDFSGVVDSALEGFDLAIAPPTVDQVLVGPVDRTRTPNIKASAILGLSEGQFPRGWRQATVFTDSDRRVMEKQKIDLEPDTQRKLLDENFLAYVAFTRAGEELLLTRATADESNRLLNPSIYWTRSREKFTNAADFTATAPRQEELPVEKISTPRQLIGGLMRWVRSGSIDDANNSPESAAWRAIYQWLATHKTCDDDIDIVRYRAWKALSANNEKNKSAHLHAQRTKNLFPAPLNAVIRQIESFRACPFQHFAQYGLGLRPRRIRQVGANDLSRVYHEVLNRLAKDLIQKQKSWADLSEAEAQDRLSQLIHQAAENLGGQLLLSTSRNRYLLDRIAWTLAWVISAHRAAAARGEFRPAFTNVRFGSKSGKESPELSALKIHTPQGHDLLISGKIDRIDLAPDGSAVAVDYRLRKNILDASDTFHGLSLQLLTCLLVLQQNGKNLSQGKLTPVAAFYVQLLREIEETDPLKKPARDDEGFNLLVQPRGIFDFDHRNKFDKQLISGKSEVLNVFVKKEDGEIGHENVSDAVCANQLASLLSHAENLIGELADGILSGDISVRPYRINQKTPCPRCEFRDVCRFEPAPRAYEDLPSLDRREMLRKVEEAHHGQ